MSSYNCYLNIDFSTWFHKYADDLFDFNCLDINQSAIQINFKFSNTDSISDSNLYNKEYFICNDLNNKCVYFDSINKKSFFQFLDINKNSNIKSTTKFLMCINQVNKDNIFIIKSSKLYNSMYNSSKHLRMYKLLRPYFPYNLKKDCLLKLGRSRLKLIKVM